MPPLLRRDSIRLLEASLEALHLAVSSLGSSKRVEFRQPSAAFSIEIGLIGSAAEMAMAAALIQASGPSAIVWPSGQYKTGGQILDDFRSLLRDATLNSAFLTQGIEDAANHRNVLLHFTVQFRRLFPVRAGGLHAGRGLLHEATVIQANQVADFLAALAKSSRVSPYVQQIPRCLWYSSDRTLVVEDLQRRLAEMTGEERVGAIASLYLILPDVPEEEPEWLEALERVSVAPKERDITYLMEAVQTAVPANIRSVRGGAGVVPVTVRPDDPNALPISPHYLRRQFNEIADLFHADVATANGRLAAGSLDLPPPVAVREIFAIGVQRAGIIGEGADLTAHQSWPSIAASLSSPGTTGPYWYLVRRTSDLGQLSALLSRVGELAPPSIRSKIARALYGIQALRDGSGVEADDPEFGTIVADASDAETFREVLIERYERNRGTSRDLTDEFIEDLRSTVEGGDPVGPLITALLNRAGLPADAKRYWSGMLASVAMDSDDVPSLVAMLAEPEIGPSHTAARKALRRIDFRLHGPPVEDV